MARIKPALTAEEWMECQRSKMRDYNKAPMVHGQFLVFAGMPQPISRLDAMAALCLHEQPFGFTHEDVEMLRRLFKQQMDMAHHVVRNNKAMVSRATRIDELADRIEALLPPED